MSGYIFTHMITHYKSMCGSRGEYRGSGPPTLKNHKNIGFSSNTGPDPLEKSQLLSQLSMLGHHQPASETPSNGVSLAGR